MKNRGKRANKRSREDELERKSHHFVKLIRKEVKKAKEFEIRKLLRRAKQAQTETKGAEDAESAAKLAAQLAAAKGADIDGLTQRAAATCGIGAPAAEPEDAAENAGPHAGPEAVIERRILGARCVQLLLDSVRQQLQSLSTAQAWAAAKAAQADEAPASADEGAQQPDQPDASNSDAPASLDNGPALASSSGEASEDDEGQWQARRDILLAAAVQPPKKKQKQEGKAEKAKKQPKPKKKKNRLGQRARQRLAVEQGWAPQPAAAPKPRPPPKQALAAPEGDDVAGLHPSWAAKRKQALVISAVPQPASKITFDDDD